MKVFSIHDDNLQKKSIIGYLYYFEKSSSFVIELCEGLSEWDVPVFFSEFVSRGIYTISKDNSLLWVKERIIPSGRQNIGIILRNHKMKEYNEMKMLVASKGRCAQDDCYIKEIPYEDVPETIRNRKKNCITECFTSDGHNVICFFGDEKVRKVNLQKLKEKYAKLQQVLSNERLFQSVRVGVGGYSICFDETVEIEAGALIEFGNEVPISAKDFFRFATTNLVDTAETCKILDCSKQNVAYLNKKEKLRPIKQGLKENLYFKGEVEKNTWD